jgi:hypothetical protein
MELASDIFLIFTHAENESHFQLLVQPKTKEWEENGQRSGYSKAIRLKGRRDHIKTHNRSPNVSSKPFHPVTLNCDLFKHTLVHSSLTEIQLRCPTDPTEV